MAEDNPLQQLAEDDSYQKPLKPKHLLKHVEQGFRMESLITPAALKKAFEAYIDEKKVLYFKTRHFKGQLVEVKQDVNIPGMWDLQEQRSNLEIRTSLCTFRNILWPDPRTSREVWPAKQRDCAIHVSVGRQPEPNSKCCSGLNQDLLDLEEEWTQGKTHESIDDYFKGYGAEMRPIKAIVCYQLGKLGTPTGEVNLASLFRHLTAVRIAKTLDFVQSFMRSGEGGNIRLFAEDSTYCSSCKSFLVKYGFEFNRRQHESFVSTNLNQNTIFMSFAKHDNALVPALNLTQVNQGLGPAAFLCPEITCNGLDAPSWADFDNGTAHIDSSPRLLKWVETHGKMNSTLRLDDMGEPVKRRGLVLKRHGKEVVPVFYWRRYESTEKGLEAEDKAEEEAEDKAEDEAD
jgi:hypothetical protein